jgi:hypothetical protein
MSEAGGIITVTVRCKGFPNGEQIIELPSTATVLQLKEHIVEMVDGLDIQEIAVKLAENQRVLTNKQVFSTLSSDSKSVTVVLCKVQSASHQMEGFELVPL